LKKGIETSEKEHELDIIVYATGFLLKENYDFITKLGLSRRFRRPEYEYDQGCSRLFKTQIKTGID